MSATDSGFFPIGEELPPIPKQQDSTDERGNGFGICLACNKVKRVWAHICGLCGEAFE